MFGQDFDVKVLSKDLEFWNLIKICVRTFFFGKQNSTIGSVVPLAMFLLILSVHGLKDKLYEIIEIEYLSVNCVKRISDSACYLPRLYLLGKWNNRFE